VIIQSILLDPTGAVWTDVAGNVSRLDPSGAAQVDAEHLLLGGSPEATPPTGQ
jgi:hypothetical protein